MCLIIMGVNAHPDYELVLVANRDEFFHRNTLNAHQWDSPAIVAGKDLDAGGTWLGADNSGRLAAITNYRNPANIKSDAPSRGMIPVRFLEGQLPAEVFLSSLVKEADSYNGFNFIVSDSSGLYHYSNVSDKITRIENGFHGISNALLNTAWPKVESGKEKLKSALSENRLDDAYLASLLRNPAVAREEELPRTGIPLELERSLSAMFIKIPGYGTRCTTVIKIKRDKSVSFTEIVYNDEGNPVDVGHFELNCQ